MPPRKPRPVPAELAAEMAALPPEGWTMSYIRSLFAASEKRREPLLLWGDELELPPGSLRTVRQKVKTTAGRLCFNKVVVEPSEAVSAALGLVDRPLDADGIRSLDGELSAALLEGRISGADMEGYVDRLNWLGLGVAHFAIPTLSHRAVEVLPEVRAARSRLMREEEAGLAASDTGAAARVEKELLGIARARLEADGEESLDLFDSGARGSFGNNYKNVSVMRGAIRTNGGGDFRVLRSCLADGTPRSEYALMAELSVSASFGRSVSTRDGGYEAKKLTGAFQTMRLGPAGSDCGTKRRLRLRVPAPLAPKLAYRWASAGGGRDALLDRAAARALAGREALLRSPMYCASAQVCSRCAGELPYMLGVTEVGLLTSRVGTRILNLALKQFHDSAIKTFQADPLSHVR